jgi:hypothetical protein
MIVKTTDVDNYIIKRNRNHDWFSLTDEDKSELVINIIDAIFENIAFKVYDLDDIDVFKAQDEDLQAAFIKAVSVFVETELKTNDEQIRKLKDNGISSFEDGVVKLSFFSQGSKSVIPDRVYRILSRYVLPAVIMR